LYINHKLTGNNEEQVRKKEQKPDLRNIKKAKTGGYQIQFIVKGKSYSDFSMNLSEAIKIRDKLKKKLKIPSTSKYRKTTLNTKKSVIPGTNKIMPTGITCATSNTKSTPHYYIMVNWLDYNNKTRVRSFYCGTESTYTLSKAKEMYAKALKFRKAFEKAAIDGTLKEFTDDYQKTINLKYNSKQLLKKHRTRSSYRRR